MLIKARDKPEYNSGKSCAIQRAVYVTCARPRLTGSAAACQKKPGVGSEPPPHRLSTEPDDMCVRFGMPYAARVSLHGALTAPM